MTENTVALIKLQRSETVQTYIEYFVLCLTV